jgi:hypothetical protein
MKKINILYWVVTVIFTTFILLSAIPDVQRAPDAEAIITHLGYPLYLLPFLGVAKILGVISVLLPILRELKEWAYAGIAIDLVGAFYSHMSVGDPASLWIFSVVGMVLLTTSYFLFRRKLDVARATAAGGGDSQGSGPNGTAFPILT